MQSKRTTLKKQVFVSDKVPKLREIEEPARKTQVIGKVDVIVAGGGVAGFSSALAASENGARVLLIERYGFLGGVAAGGYSVCLPLVAFEYIGGIFNQLVERLLKFGGVIDPAEAKRITPLDDLSKGFPNTPYDPEVMKLVMMQMLEEKRVNVLLESLIVDVLCDNQTVKGVIVENKSGRQAILADVIVDSTGDCDVLAKAGGAFQQPSDPLPVTLMFRMNNVDTETFTQKREKNPKILSELVKKAQDDGKLHLPPAPRKFIPAMESWAGPLIDITYPPCPPWHRKNEVLIWGAHLTLDGTDTKDISRGYLSLRNQVFEIVKFFQRDVPGFKDSYLQDTAPQLGVRETRHGVGKYILTVEDILTGKQFVDAVVQSGRWEKPELPYTIPYRCFCPEKIERLLLVGKCLSVTTETYSQNSPRDIPTCIATGQVAGTAAALAVRAAINPRNLEVSYLRQELIKQGLLSSSF